MYNAIYLGVLRFIHMGFTTIFITLRKKLGKFAIENENIKKNYFLISDFKKQIVRECL